MMQWTSLWIIIIMIQNLVLALTFTGWPVYKTIVIVDIDSFLIIKSANNIQKKTNEVYH